MTLPEPVQIRLGPPTASDHAPASGTLAWPDLDPTHRPGDWPALLQRLATHVPADRPALIMHAATVVPAAVIDQLRTLAQRQEAAKGIIAPLSNLEPGHSPLPPGTTMTAPLAIDDIDRCCAWLGREALFDHDRPMAGCALWQAGSARRLLDAGWSPGENLPAGFSCLISERLFAGDPDRNLVGPPVWPVNDIPPPVHPLDRLRARWPLAGGPDQGTRTLSGTDLQLAQLETVLPDGPLPGRGQEPVVLHICHGWGGGSLRFIQDLAGADNQRCHLLLSAHGDRNRRQYGEWLELRPARAGDLLLARFRLHLPISDTARQHEGYGQVLARVLAQWRVDAIMVSSLIGHDLQVLATGLPTVWLCHDYYPLWPQLHCDFGDPERAFDRDDLQHTLAAAPSDLFREHHAEYWWTLRQQTVAALFGAGVTMVAPTSQVMGNWQRLAPELAGLDWHVIPHGIPPWPAAGPPPTAASQPASAHAPSVPGGRNGRLRVLVPGRIAGGKGMDLLPAMLQALTRLAGGPDHGIELVLLGAGSSGEQLHGRSGLHIIADYHRDDLPVHLARLQPDLALLPATVAETFGYLLSELRSLAVPVLATAIGSYLERIEEGVDGLLVEADPEAIARRLLSLRDDPGPLAPIRRRLAAEPARTITAMAADYQPLLPASPGHHPPVTLDTDLAAMSEADLGRQLLELGHRLASMRRELADGRRELRERAKWGFDLARQLATNKDWAQSLDRQVSQLDQVVLRLQLDVEHLHEELAQRTKWAQSLDQQVNERTAWAQDLDRQLHRLHQHAGELQEHLDLVLSSRSWRLMAPARVLARKLRALRTRTAFQIRRLGNLASRGRLSLATRGLRGTWQHLRQRRRQPAPASDPVLQAALSAKPRAVPCRLPDSDAPQVSIIIPVYGNLDYTLACLASVAEHAGPTAFEIIVVDDASPDDSADTLAAIPGLHLLRNQENLGFIGSCNAGAATARGRWLLFLNNDTQVTAGWLEAMLDTFTEFNRAGLVGARLVYPDGRLQEAGGLVFSDGSGWNYGRFGDPADPAYSYARATDYCSGAAIMLEKQLFERLGGFDTRYAPAYYEDTDLAFKVRQAGLQVIYQPAATVIHFEGITSGTDTGSGVKQYQLVNQGKFLAAWHEQLPKQPAPGTAVERIVRQAPKGRILVIDATTPEPDQDSGSVRLVNLLRLLRESGRHVTFFADNKAHVPGHSQRLQRMGIEVLYHPWLGHPADWLREHGPDLDAVLVCRHYIAANYIDLVREYAPKARFIFDTVDLHYLREERAATLADSDEIRRQAARTREQEQRLIRDSDITLVVSPAEQALLAQELPEARVEVLSNVHPVPGRRRGFDERRDLMFVGGFQHPPNVDAVLWFAEQVLPRVRKALPDVGTHIIGSKMPPAISGLQVPGLDIHGYVEDLEPYLDGCRIALAPLRYGAGVKGKVNMSMSYGQPVVATSVAAEGMHLAPGSDILVADSPDLFAAQIVRLYRNPALWRQLSDAGIANVRRHFSFEAAGNALERILAH